MTRYRSLADRLIANSYVDPDTGCWIWTGGRNNRGYPRLSVHDPERGTVKVYAHRLALKVFAGRLSPKQEAHHRCICQLCINPDHLEATSKKIHRQRHQQLRKAAAHGEAQA